MKSKPVEFPISDGFGRCGSLSYGYLPSKYTVLATVNFFRFFSILGVSENTGYLYWGPLFSETLIGPAQAQTNERRSSTRFGLSRPGSKDFTSEA